MSAIRLPNKHRPNHYRRFEPGEYPRLMAELRRSGDLRARHWRLLTRLAIEASAPAAAIAGARWEQFSADLRTWNIPQIGSCPGRTVTLTRTGRRIVRVLGIIADPASPRLFHSLPEKPRSLSHLFGRAAARAGLKDFCFGDLEGIGLAKRLQTSPRATIEQIAWALGKRHAVSPPYFRPYVRSS